MKRQVVLRSVAAVALLGSALWYGRSRAQSGGLAEAPVLYSGYVEDAGVPVDGTRSIGLSLWTATDTTTPSNRVCEQVPAPSSVAKGWFTVQLDAGCLDAIHRHRALYLQFVVEATAFPLQPIGAVPYSVRALEYTSGSRLRKIMRTAADGAKEPDPTRWWDSQRNEECTFLKTSAAGQLASGLCLPPTGLAGNCPRIHTDATCGSAPITGTVSSIPPKYVPSSTASSGLATPGAPIPVYCSLPGILGCIGSSTLYPVATDIPASDFVAWADQQE